MNWLVKNFSLFKFVLIETVVLISTNLNSLGLSLAYDIITKGHGETLKVESVEGVGSEFIITI